MESSRSLTLEQVEELHEFCYVQSVVHYDVQAELVDHLASAIEEIWCNNSQPTFQDALYQVSQQFGGHAGFVIIRQEKEAALRKKYRRLLWQFTLGFFKLPKIIVTISFALVIFYGLQFAKNDLWITMTLLIGFSIFSFYYLYFYFPKHVRIKVNEGHAFLFNEISNKGIAYKTVILSGALLSVISHTSNFSTVESIVFAAIASLYSVLLFGDCFYISRKMREHFEQQFPQFVKS